MPKGALVSWPNLFRRMQAGILGYIEHADRRTIRGWAWNARRPRDHLGLDVFIGGLYAGRACTGQFRDDLLSNGIGDGSHAFVFHVPSALPMATITLDDVEVLFDGAPPTQLGKINAGAIVKEAEVRPSNLDPAAFFRPLIEHLVSNFAASASDEPGERRQMNQLLARAEGHQVSAFLHHLARKHERPGSRQRR